MSGILRCKILPHVFGQFTGKFNFGMFSLRKRNSEHSDEAISLVQKMARFSLSNYMTTNDDNIVKNIVKVVTLKEKSSFNHEYTFTRSILFSKKLRQL